MTGEKNWTKSFALSHLGGNSEELKKTVHLVSAGRLQGRTPEDPLPCFSREMTQKNWIRPFILPQLRDYKEELKKTWLCLAGRTEEDPTLACRKNWRRPGITLLEELKKTLHLVGAEKWLRRTGWRRPHNLSQLEEESEEPKKTLHLVSAWRWLRTSENSLSCLSWEITRKNWTRSYFAVELECRKQCQLWQLT